MFKETRATLSTNQMQYFLSSVSSSYCLFEVFFLSSDWPLLLCCRLSRAHSIYGTKISDTGSVTSGSLEHLVTHSDLEITCVTGHLRGPVSKLYSLQLSKQIPTHLNYFLVFQGSLSKDSGDGILMATYIHLMSQPMTTSFV